MRHRVDHRKLGRHTSHRKALLRNMATSLILAERIETTLPKAKELRRLADRLVTFGKDGSLHARRQAARVIQNPEALKKLFTTLAERFKDRAGGYTRIFHFGFRRGDSAEMAAIEYLGYELPVKEKTLANEKSKEKAKKQKETKKKEPKKEPKKPDKKFEKEQKKEDKKGSGEKKWSLFNRNKKGS